MSYEKKTLSVLSLVMINIIAIDSLRTLPMGAEYGFSLVFFYLVAAITFFFPVSLVAAELATGWPETGGIYVWIREAFGKQIAFITIFLQWFYNICWYPTIMSFIAATLAYCIHPALVNDKFYMLSVITIFFWVATFINFFGMGASTIFSTICALIGTILPMIFISILGGIWICLGKPLQIHFSWQSFFPDMTNIQHLVLLTGLIFGLVGMEMSAVHAAEVNNPQRDYPKAIFWSALIILTTLVISSLAIALVVPSSELNIVSGLLQAFDVFFTAFGIKWFTPILAFFIICGAVGGVNAWILGPGKSLLAASRDGCLPQFLTRTNKKGVPTMVLIAQGIIFMFLSSVFLFMPSVSSSFWVLSAITSILALVVYVVMFLAALRLRYKYPEVKRAFIIPGGMLGLWCVCLLGVVSCLFVIMIGFIPPSQIAVGNLFVYEMILCIGVMMACLVPLLIYHLTKKLKKAGDFEVQSSVRAKTEMN